MSLFSTSGIGATFSAPLVVNISSSLCSDASLDDSSVDALSEMMQTALWTAIRSLMVWTSRSTLTNLLFVIRYSRESTSISLSSPSSMNLRMVSVSLSRSFGPMASSLIAFVSQ